MANYIIAMLEKVPKIIKKIFYNQVWDIPNAEKKIYLTFDDGPTPEITEWVLNLLEKENIKATFFCIGSNIKKHPDIFKKIITAGHSVGNHTFNHLKGWKTSKDEYIENVDLCRTEMSKLAIENGNLFRPPYGKIKPNQCKTLRKKGYKIIMWDILSKDYDSSTTPEKCLKHVKKTKTGSIIVFHDSIKARKNLEYTLPRAITFLKSKGFVFNSIN